MSQLKKKTDEVETVEEFQFEPIKGYPILNWRGKRPFRSTNFYPAQLKETHGDAVDGWFNRIFWGDNLQVMSHMLKEFRGKVDLIYIDPPFDSKADYKKKIKAKGKNTNNDHTAFEEKQYTDIWTNDEFLQFIYERIVLLKELLSDTGSIFVHCDPKKNHFIRCILEEVFGKDNFVNEIIWSYRRWTGSANNFLEMHDNIYFFSKTKDFKFNTMWTDYTEGSINRKKNFHTRIKDDDVFETSVNDKGVKDNDVWNISVINSQALERTGYPTQKPEELLDKIIECSTSPSDLVFDCFMGSGTLQAVAARKGRKYIGADINLGAVQTTTKRLIGVNNELEANKSKLNLEDGIEKFYTGFQVYNVNHYDVFRNPIQAKELLIEALEIQPLERNTLYDGEKDGRMVKVMPVNRIATRADLNELITNFDYKTFEKRQADKPNQPVERILIVCMGHEPDLAAILEQEAGFKLDVEVVDILRDRQDLQFKRDAEAKVGIKDGKLGIEAFYPMNLLQKLSMMKENVEDWKELVESVMIDWNYDGAIFEPKTVDIPEKKELVSGIYDVPKDAGTIRVKITDLLSESLEIEVDDE